MDRETRVRRNLFRPVPTRESRYENALPLDAKVDTPFLDSQPESRAVLANTTVGVRLRTQRERGFDGRPQADAVVPEPSELHERGV